MNRPVNRPADAPVLAVDIGGTKLAGGLVDADGTLRADRRVPTGADPWGELCTLLDAVLGSEQVSGIGVGCGGPLRRREGWVAPHNLLPWRGGFALVDALTRRYGLPVRLQNDAVALLAAEHWLGAARGVDDVLGMVVSTGVGGGLLSAGKVVDGRTGNAGHVGHIVVDQAGPVCGCGGRGCVEAFARGPAVVAWARERGSQALDGRELAALAAGGDPVAVAALGRAGRALGAGIASAAAVMDVELVVIGGGFAHAGDALWGPLRDAVREHARLPYLTGLRVELAELGPEAGLVGAAALVHGGDRYWTPG